MIDRFQECFQEEARELVTELESALLEMDQSHDDPEIVGRAFRALHTIKGSGAMFGFDEIAKFTHAIEAVFDQLRKGKLSVFPGLINLALAAGDQIKTMLDEAAGRGTASRARSAEILAELSRLTGGDQAHAAPAPEQRAESPCPDSGTGRQWRIRFRPGEQALLNGINPLLLLAELRELGTLELRADTSAIPPLSEMDPELCYVAWDMLLKTTAAAEAIRDVFIFVEGECELAIDEVPGVESPAAVAPAARSSRAVPVKPSPGNAGAPEPGASSLRVSADKLDQLVNLVGELVTMQARLSEAAARSQDAEILDIAQAGERLTAELRENSMSIRMLPLRTTFERFRRLVHDLSRELNKQVELGIEGADTELDKTVIDQLNDPLVHLIRNSMDHGIETPEARRAAGKQATATIQISAQHSGAHVLIRVTDDGRGLDVDAVRARAIEQGLIDPSSRLSEQEIVSLILAPGFSTAREVTDVSGRGVGMDVVRRRVEALHGSVEIASSPGLGLTVTLRLPLTLAIIDGLLVRVGATHFVLPLANSLECVELRSEDIEAAHGNHIAVVRGETVPYIRLSEYLGLGTERPPREQIMLVETDEGDYGFVVDEVLGNHQTVIKNLGRFYRDVPMISGATILGNGAVALILDPQRLVQSALEAAEQKGAGGRKSRRSPVTPGREPGQTNASMRKEEDIHAT